MYVIWTDCPGLDKFFIVSGLRSHDYINDSHVPNGLNWHMACQVKNIKLQLKLRPYHMTGNGTQVASAIGKSVNHLLFERDNFWLELDTFSLERDNFSLERDTFSLERDTFSFERDNLSLEQDKKGKILLKCGTKTASYIRDKSRTQGRITISSDPSPLFGIQFLAIPFAFDFAFKMHIKEKRFKHSIN